MSLVERHKLFLESELNSAAGIRRMTVMRNIGMILLGIYLIIDGLLGFGLNLGPAIFLLYLVALCAGAFIILGQFGSRSA